MGLSSPLEHQKATEELVLLSCTQLFDPVTFMHSCICSIVLLAYYLIIVSGKATALFIRTSLGFASTELVQFLHLLLEAFRPLELLSQKLFVLETRAADSSGPRDVINRESGFVYILK